MEDSISYKVVLVYWTRLFFFLATKIMEEAAMNGYGFKA